MLEETFAIHMKSYELQYFTILVGSYVVNWKVRAMPEDQLLPMAIAKATMGGMMVVI